MINKIFRLKDFLKLLKTIANVEMDLENRDDVARLFLMMAKAHGLPIEEDSIWIIIRGEVFRIKLVKNLLLRVRYGPFPVATHSFYDVEIYLPHDSIKLSYHSYHRSKLPEYMKTYYDMDYEDALEIFTEVWSQLLKYIKPRWRLKTLDSCILYWILYRKAVKSFKENFGGRNIKLMPTSTPSLNTMFNIG